MARTRCMLDEQGYMYTQICSIYCFSTATVIRERASVLRYAYILVLLHLEGSGCPYPCSWDIWTLDCEGTKILRNAANRCRSDSAICQKNGLLNHTAASSVLQKMK